MIEMTPLNAHSNQYFNWKEMRPIITLNEKYVIRLTPRDKLKSLYDDDVAVLMM